MVTSQTVLNMNDNEPNLSIEDLAAQLGGLFNQQQPQALCKGFSPRPKEKFTSNGCGPTGVTVTPVNPEMTQVSPFHTCIFPTFSVNFTPPSVLHATRNNSST